MHRRQKFLPGLMLFFFVLMPGIIFAQEPTPPAPTEPPADSSKNLVIVDLNNKKFPEITVTLRYFDEQNNPIRDFDGFEVEIAGEQISDIEVKEIQRPIAVSLVVDLSAAMRADGINPNTRFKDMKELLTSFVPKLQIPSTQVSLIVFDKEVKTYHGMTNDMGTIINTINDTNTEKPFVALESDEGLDPYPLQDAISDEGLDPYPLQDAILEGLRQFDEVDEYVPRMLFVFAAGTPEAVVDLETLRAELASTPENPLTIAVIGFGGDDGTTIPQANPELLQQIAGNGEWLHFYAGNVADKNTLTQEAEQLFNKATQRSYHYQLRFQADTALKGEQALVVRAGNAEDSRTVGISAIPPRISLWLDSGGTDFQDRVTLRINVDFAQTDLTKVEYLLDNYIIETSTNPSDNFAVTFNAYDKDFQEKFPPGEHTLQATAIDENGEVAQSEPISITVSSPPPAETPLEAILTEYKTPALLVFGGIIVVVLAFILIPYGKRIIQSRVQSPVPMPEPTDKPVLPWEDDDVDTIIPDEDKTEQFDEDKTEQFDEDKTEQFDAGETEEQYHFRVVLVKGKIEEGATEFSLQGKGRHYGIGRPSKNSHPEIPLPNSKVSRNHAELVVLKDGNVELIAGESANGTFVGDDKRKLGNGEHVKLKEGDTFWIGPELQLRLEKDEKP